jgi:hypothetical protein
MESGVLIGLLLFLLGILIGLPLCWVFLGSTFATIVLISGSTSFMAGTFYHALDNYVLLSPEAINLDDRNRSALQEVMNAEPLALIEYWAVDPSYDGQVFRSVWQDYRGNTDNDSDELRVVTEAVVQAPAATGTRCICVRAVDVFGFESEVVIDGVEVTR